MSGKHRRKKSFLGMIVLLSTAVIVIAAAFMLFSSTQHLHEQEQELTQRMEQLEKQIDEEKERTEQLEEQKKHVKTDSYIKEVAREKLGLIDPGEVLFREEGK